MLIDAHKFQLSAYVYGCYGCLFYFYFTVRTEQRSPGPTTKPWRTVLKGPGAVTALHARFWHFVLALAFCIPFGHLLADVGSSFSIIQRASMTPSCQRLIASLWSPGATIVPNQKVSPTNQHKRLDVISCDCKPFQRNAEVNPVEHVL